MLEVYIDGASRGNPGPAGIGIVLKDRAVIFEYRSYIGIATNNQAEYRALIKALEILEEKSFISREVTIYSDSQLLVRQLRGEYRVRDPKLIKLFRKVKLKLRNKKLLIKHVSRQENLHADMLANLAIEEALR